MKPLPRRSWLLGVALGVLGSATLVQRGTRPRVPPSRPSWLALARRLNTLLNGKQELDALAALQASTLHRVPRVEELLGALYPQSRAEGLLRVSDFELERALRDDIDADFEGGRVTNVAGWLLSHTEARLGMLPVSLAHEGQSG